MLPEDQRRPWIEQRGRWDGVQPEAHLERDQAEGQREMERIDNPMLELWVFWIGSVRLCDCVKRTAVAGSLTVELR